MVAKRISLAAGFEDLLGTLRGTAGDLPSEGEMAAASGESGGVAAEYYDALGAAGRRISRRIQLLDRQLEAAEDIMRESIAQQRATESQAAETLRKLLADLEGVHTEVVGETPAPAKAAKRSSEAEHPGLGKPGSN